MVKGKKRQKAKAKKKQSKKYRHCSKRYSLRLNQRKWEKLLEILQGYAQQKDYFLAQYRGEKNIWRCFHFISVRRELVGRKYQNPFGLGARLWKLALKDALSTLDRYWAALAAGVEEEIFRSPFTKEEKDYLRRAVYSRANLQTILRCGAKARLSTELGLEKRRRIVPWIVKHVRNKTNRGRFPRVRMRRSFLAEPETYRIFEYRGRQYIAITSLVSGERIIIPLTGKTNIKGQIRIVFDFEKQRVEIHYSVETPVWRECQGEKIGIDLGITEVFTDSGGDRWGTDFGATLDQYSQAHLQKNRRRNKLHQVAKKHRQKGNPKKAQKVYQHNLGKKKRTKQLRKQRTELARQVNEAVIQFLDQKQPALVVAEQLSASFGKAKSKHMSRLVSAWVRAIMNERIDFQVSQRGSLVKRVNCAHGSRVCPLCWWVHADNRKGDRFKCQVCGYAAASDHVAALEILRRENDPEIFLWTPKNQVRSLLLARFRRRLESGELPLPLSRLCWEPVRREWGKEGDVLLSKLGVDQGGLSATVAGKTPDTPSTISLHQDGVPP